MMNELPICCVTFSGCGSQAKWFQLITTLTRSPVVVELLRRMAAILSRSRLCSGRALLVLQGARLSSSGLYVIWSFVCSDTASLQLILIIINDDFGIVFVGPQMPPCDFKPQPYKVIAASR